MRAGARSTDPQTSFDAARSVDLTAGQEKVLDAFRRHATLTDEQLVRMLLAELSPSGARSRRAELVEAGLVEWTGETVRSATGRQTRVWRLAPKANKPEQGRLL